MKSESKGKRSIKLMVEFVVAYLVFQLINMLVGIPTSMILQQKYASLMPNASQEELYAAITGSTAYVAAGILPYIIFIILFMIFIKRFEAVDVEKIFIGNNIKRNVVIGVSGVIGGIVTMVVFMFFVTSIFKTIEYTPGVADLTMSGSKISLLIAGLVLSISAAVFEELIFRVFLLGELRKLGNKYALLITCFLFMLVEIQGVILPIDLIASFVAGLLFSYIYMSTDCIYGSIGLHSILHFALLSVVSLPKYGYDSALFKFETVKEIAIGSVPLGTSTSVGTLLVNVLGILVVYVLSKSMRANNNLKRSI